MAVLPITAAEVAQLQCSGSNNDPCFGAVEFNSPIPKNAPLATYITVLDSKSAPKGVLLDR